MKFTIWWTAIAKCMKVCPCQWCDAERTLSQKITEESVSFSLYPSFRDGHNIQDAGSMNRAGKSQKSIERLLGFDLGPKIHSDTVLNWPWSTGRVFKSYAEEDHNAVCSLSSQYESAIDLKDDLTINLYNINTVRLSPLILSSLHTIELCSTAHSTNHHSNIARNTQSQNQHLVSKRIIHQNAILRLLLLSFRTYLPGPILPRLWTQMPFLPDLLRALPWFFCCYVLQVGSWAFFCGGGTELICTVMEMTVRISKHDREMEGDVYVGSLQSWRLRRMSLSGVLRICWRGAKT